MTDNTSALTAELNTLAEAISQQAADMGLTKPDKACMDWCQAADLELIAKVTALLGKLNVIDDHVRMMAPGETFETRLRRICAYHLETYVSLSMPHA